MPCRKLNASCRDCGGEIVIVLDRRTLVAVCKRCKRQRPASDLPQPSHPLLEGGKK